VQAHALCRQAGLWHLKVSGRQIGAFGLCLELVFRDERSWSRAQPLSKSLNASRSFPLLKGEGANLRHLALQIEHRRCDAGSGAFPRFFEAVPEKCVARCWNRARSEALEGRAGFGCPGAKVGKENAQIHQPAVCGWPNFFAGTRGPLYLASASDRMRDVVADMAWQNLGAAIHVGVLIPNEPPKVREGDGLIAMSDRHH
jgi:hypothetical protein